jgi:isocitrate dehydrogenase
MRRLRPEREQRSLKRFSTLHSFPRLGSIRPHSLDMTSYKLATVPSAGERIAYEGGVLRVPDNPIIPYVEGDGTGADIWRASVRVFDAAIEKAYGGQRRVSWMEVFAGEKAFTKYKDWLPQETVDAMQEFRVSIKGPLTTPVGGGIRSLNVTLRQVLDLYACIRPVRWFEGVGSPMKDPGKLDIVVFRENTEDVYAGIEWKAGSPEAEKLRAYIKNELGKDIRDQSAIGIKPMSAFGSKRLVEMAIRYALARNKPSVTLMHKGNIMKFTEGAFRDWGYEVAREKFAESVVSEADLSKGGANARADAVIIKDRIADSMFQQLLLRPDEYSVIATPNLNGDYVSDAAAAQVGGLGIAPGGNVGDGVAVFEATHGTAPKYANLDKINPGSVILSGVMMFEYLGWNEAGTLVTRGLENAIKSKRVTYDLARQMPGSTEVSTTAFGDEIIRGMTS